MFLGPHNTCICKVVIIRTNTIKTYRHTSMYMYTPIVVLCYQVNQKSCLYVPCEHTHLHMHTHTYTHVYTHTCTHTHRQVSLNGHLLQLVGDQLPELQPEGQEAKDSIFLPALSFGFHVFKDVKAPACM